MNTQAILEARQTAGQRWKMARIWHKTMRARMNEVLGSSGIEVLPFAFEAEYDEVSAVEARSEEHNLRYRADTDTIELGFILLFHAAETTANFLTVRFRIIVQFDEKERKCRLYPDFHPAGDILQSEPLHLDPTQPQTDVPNFALDLARKIIALMCTSRTWMRSLSEPLHLQYPDSWLGKPKRQFTIALTSDDQHFEGLIEEC